MSKKHDKSSKSIEKCAFYEGFGTPQTTPYQLEPRILLDAAAGALLADAVAPQEAPTDADVTEAVHANNPEPAQDSSTDTTEHEFITTANQQQIDYIEENHLNITNVIFIDANVENPQTLLEQLTQNTAVFYLDAGLDGVSQIEQLLQALSQQNEGIQIEALHLVSHGDEAQINLGSSTLTLDSMVDQYSESLQHIGNLLSEDADILIYGCNFGKGNNGLAAVNKLAELTQADIAASDDITASPLQGGDAELEVHSGEVNAAQVITDASIDDYLGVLTIPTGTPSTLVNGLGGDNGFGEVVTFYRYSSYNNTYSSPNVQMDDGVSMQIDITGVSELWADGVNFKNASDEPVYYTSFSINSNGMIVFGGSSSNFSPSGISDGLDDPNSNVSGQGLPMFAAFWADMDNTATTMSTSEGGTSTGANRAYISVEENRVVITWNDYGFYRKGTTPYAFQIILQPGEGNGDINVQYRYEATPALTPPSYSYPDGYQVPAKIAAGFNIGVTGGTEGVHYYQLPYMEGSSNDLTDIYSDLATRPGATTGVAGVWDFQIVDGVGVSILADSGNLNVGLGADDAAMNIAAPTDLVGNALAEEDVVITVTGLPDAGTVTYADGTSVANGATLTIDQLTSLQYDAPDTYSDPGTFTYSVTRSATTSNAVIDIGLVAAPAIASLDGSLTYTEGDGVVVIDADASVSDGDSINFNRGNLTVSITDGDISDEDKLAIYTADGLFSLSGSTVSHSGTQIGTVTGGTNGNDLVITFNANATTVIVSSLIKHISYQNLNASNPTAGDRALDFVVTDDTGSASNTASKTISVVSVNDVPVITAGNTLSYNEGDSASIIASALTLSDADDAELTGATISITEYVSGQDILGFTNTSSITGSFEASSGVLTLSGDASVASYQAALRSVTYFNSSTDPTTAARTINWAVTDAQEGTNAAATSTITIAAIADAPVITTNSNTLTYDEGDGAVVIDATLALSDNDSTTMSGAVITISSGFADGDVLGFSGQNGITGSYNAAAHKLMLSGTATVDNYQTALNSITFTNNSENLASGSRTISWVVTDSGSVSSVAASSTIQYLSVNDAPTLASFGAAALAYTQGDDATVIDSSVTIADVDSTDFNGGTLTVTLSGVGTGADSGDVLSIVSGNGVTMSGSSLSYGGSVIASISGGMNDSPLVITFNNNANVAAVQAVFRQVAYQNINVDTPSDGARSVAFVLTDGDGGTSTFVSKGIVMMLVNSAPVINDLNGTLNYTEGAGSVVLDADASVSDADLTDFAGGTLTVSIVTNRVSTEDVLSINSVGTGSGQISVSGSDISYENTVIATFTGGATTNHLVITFNSNANVEAVSALIKQITYQNINTNDPSISTRVVNFVLTDGDGGTSLISTRNVAVTAVNDAPVINNVSGTLPYTEGDGAQIIDSDASLTDVDSTDFNSGSLTVSFSAGGVNVEDILSINHQGSAAGEIGVSGSSISYAGTTIANFSGGSNGEDLVITFNGNANATSVSALLKQLTYQNIDNDNPTAADRTVSMVFKDGDGGTSAEATKTISVTGVNDAPTLSGIGGLSNFDKGGAPITVIPDGATVTVADVDSDNFNGGNLTVSFAFGGEDGQDVLSINNQGAGNIDVDGTTINYSDVAIGAFTGGNDGTDLVITFNDSADAAAVSALIKQITYQNIDNANPTAGKRVISFALTDSDGGASSEAAIYTINNAPSINLAAGGVNYDEGDAATVIDGTAIISIGDNASRKLTVSIAGGDTNEDVLSILTGNGITLEDGNVKYNDTTIATFEGGSDGTDLVITFVEDTAEAAFNDSIDTAANSIIKQIAYSNTDTDSPTEGQRTISFAITDSATATDNSPSSKVLEVFAVNDAPTMTVSVATPTFTEGDAAIQIDDGFTVADVDLGDSNGDGVGDFAGGTLTVGITAGGTNAEDVLSVINQGSESGQIGISGNYVTYGGAGFATFAGGFGGEDLVFTFNENASVIVVNALAQQITYQNTNTDNPSGTSRTVSFTLTDGDGGTSAAVTKTVSVTPVNDIPVINNLNGTLAYTEGDGAVVIDTDASVADVDSTDFDQGTLTISISNSRVSTEDVLSINNVGTGTGQIGVSGSDVLYENIGIGSFRTDANTGNLIIELDSTSTPAAISALIKQITYQNTNTDNPSDAERTLSFVLTDGDTGTSQTSTKTITVAKVNDAPTISEFGTTVYYTEGDGAVVLDSAVSLADVDSVNFATGSLTVSFSSGDVDAEDILSIKAGDPISITGKTISYNNNAIGTFSGGSQGKSLVITFNSNATVEAVDALIEKITYKNLNTDAPTTTDRTINFSLSDGDGATSNLGDVTVSITPVNNAPSIKNLEGTVQFNEGGDAIVIDSDASVADVDSADFDTGKLTVSISENREADEDVLSINNVGTGSGQISVSSSDIYYGGSRAANKIGQFEGGATTNNLVITFNANATPEAVSALIKQITYQNTNDANPNAAERTIAFTLTDGDGATSVTSSKQVQIVEVNNPPVITFNALEVTFTEGGSPVVLDGNASISDVDSSTFYRGALTVSITSGGVDTQDVLSVNHVGTSSGEIGVSGSSITYGDEIIGNMTGGREGGGLEISFTSKATKDAVNALVKQITYFNTNANNPTTTARTIEMVVSDDGGGESDPVTITLSITPVNDAPVMTAGATMTFVEGSVAKVIDSSISLSDVDDTQISGATISISTGLTDGDLLSFTNTGTITGNFANGVLTLTGTDTIANYEAALRSVKYSTSNDDPTASASQRTISWQVTDANAAGIGAQSSTVATSTIEITAVNDAPVLTAGGVLAYTEGEEETAIDSGLTITDADDTHIVSATVSIGTGFTEGDLLSFDEINNFGGNYDADTGVLTITSSVGSDTVAHFQSALRMVKFSSSSEDPTIDSTSRTIIWQVTDADSDGAGAQESNSAISIINITAVNDAPTITVNTSGPLWSFTEGGEAQVIDDSISLSDVDDTTISRAQISISDGFFAGDILSFADTDTISGSYNASTGVLTLIGDDSLANYQSALRSVKYITISEDPAKFDATRTFSWQLTDADSDKVGAATSLSVSNTINIIEVNDIAVITGDAIKIPFNDRGANLFKGLIAEDLEDGDITSSIEIINNPIVYDRGADYQVTYRVTDADNESVEFTRTVTVEFADDVARIFVAEGKTPIINGATDVPTGSLLPLGQKPMPALQGTIFQTASNPASLPMPDPMLNNSSPIPESTVQVQASNDAQYYNSDNTYDVLGNDSLQGSDVKVTLLENVNGQWQETNRIENEHGVWTIENNQLKFIPNDPSVKLNEVMTQKYRVYKADANDNFDDAELTIKPLQGSMNQLLPLFDQELYDKLGELAENEPFENAELITMDDFLQLSFAEQVQQLHKVKH